MSDSHLDDGSPFDGVRETCIESDRQREQAELVVEMARSVQRRSQDAVARSWRNMSNAQDVHLATKQREADSEPALGILQTDDSATNSDAQGLA